MLNRTIPIIILACLTPACTNEPVKLPPPEEPDTEVQEKPPEATTSFLKQDEGSGIDYKAKFTHLPPEDESIITLGQYQIKKPFTWVWVPPKSTFVLCNYVLPGILGEESGLFSISEFEIGEGGDFDTNILRWKSHFRTHEGAPVKATVSKIDINNVTSNMVHVRGEYMGAGAAWHKPDHTLLIVLFEDDSNRFFIKLLGPTETILAHRESLYEALQSLELTPAS